MKKIVLTFGLISGAILSLMMVVTMPFVDKIGFDKAEILGYTTMVLSFLMVYAGIRSYRDNVGGGSITFARAVGVGLLITLISCICYVVTWEILYFNLPSMHQFMDKYAAYMSEQARASGASQEAIEVQRREIGKYKELYENPLFNVAMTFSEPFPVGLVITVISAAILKKKNPDSLPQTQMSGSD
ncbi:MAG TPA: DUF4199 domain-containing protein [Terriglobia bacterium]|nr:DUF4199 domain-containing protein [Terriglobia bacterium]